MMHVVVFGAGHVGHALIEVLGTLPCVVQWVDARDERFPTRSRRTCRSKRPPSSMKRRRARTSS